MARPYPAHMRSMKARYGKVLPGMTDVHRSPLYSKNTGGGTEGLTPSYVQPLADTALAGFGASSALTSPLMGMGNGGVSGRGNSNGHNPLPSFNPNYEGSATVFLVEHPGPVKSVASAPTIGDGSVGPPRDPGLVAASAAEENKRKATAQRRKPLLWLGAAALGVAALYGLSR